MNEKEKLVDGLTAFSDFLNMLDGPNDIYKQILLTVLFEELFAYNLGLEFQDEEGE